MEYIIREAISTDLPAILSLYGQSDIDDGRVIDLEMAMAVFMKIKSYPNYRLLVAFSEDCIGNLRTDYFGQPGSYGSTVSPG
jgi:hypothetical protein